VTAPPLCAPVAIHGARVTSDRACGICGALPDADCIHPPPLALTLADPREMIRKRLPGLCDDAVAAILAVVLADRRGIAAILAVVQRNGIDNTAALLAALEGRS